MNIEQDLAALQQMSTDELRDRYADVFGEEPRSRHKAYLIRKVAWRLKCSSLCLSAISDLQSVASAYSRSRLSIDSEDRTRSPLPAAGVSWNRKKKEFETRSNSPLKSQRR